MSKILSNIAGPQNAASRLHQKLSHHSLQMRAMDNTAIGMLTANSGYTAQIEENLKAHLHKKLNKIEMGCMSKINDFRADVMHDAALFIKKKLDQTTKMLTNEHHRIIEQFFFFKE